jgi:hypothetical protein
VRVGIATAPLEGFDHMLTQPTEDHYYWIRAVDFAGNYSTWEPPDVQGGYLVPGTGSYDEIIRQLLDALIGNITEDQLYQDLSARIDKIEVNESGITVLNQLVEDNYAEYQTTVALVNGHTTTISQIDQRVTQNAANIALRVQLSTYNAGMASVQVTLDAHQTTIGQLVSQYMVKLDVNGYCSGFGLYNDGSWSEAIFLVDRFMIVTPGKAPRVPFVVGVVNGVSTVGSNGQLVVDGTILAKSIGANQIDGTHITARTINAGHIQTGSLTSDLISVNTLRELTPNLGILVQGTLQSDAYHYLNLDARTSQLFIRSGKTAGFYVRADGVAVFGQFSGDVSTRRALVWDGTQVIAYGDIIGTANIKAKGVTNVASWAYVGPPRLISGNVAYQTLYGKWAGSTLQIHCEATCAWEWPLGVIDLPESYDPYITFGLYRGTTLLKTWRKKVVADTRDAWGALNQPFEGNHWITDDGTSGNITYYLKITGVHDDAFVMAGNITIVEFRR